MLVSRAKAEEAATVFGFDITSGLLDAQQVNAAYKTEAKKAHPDAGGTAEAFARVDWAKHVLLAWLKKAPSYIAPAVEDPDCPACGGRGKAHQRSGFKRGLLRMCVKCHGTGKVMDIDRTGEIL